MAALVGVCLLAVAACGQAADMPPMRSEEPPFFTADLAITLDSLGRSAAGVAISVPYTELEWRKLPTGYGAGIDLTVSITPRDKRRLYGNGWQRRIAVPSFSATRSPNTALLEKQVFPLPAGRYSVRVEVSDLNGGAGSHADGTLEVPDYEKVPVGFGDLELGIIDSSGAFVPVNTRTFGLNASLLAARVTIFDRRGGPWPRTYPLQWRLRGEEDEELATGTYEVTVEHSAQPVIIRPRRNNLFLGTYSLEVELSEGKQRWRVDRRFDVEESGPPTGKEFERMLEPLGYIADSREIDHLRALPPDKQRAGWDDFWKRRDPTPDTERNEAMIEFFRRVNYATRHFQGFGPGWRSDMGRVYIKLGPPDQIEQRAATSQSAQTEIWYYNQPYRRIVFVDRDGFGRFVRASSGVD